MKKIKLLIPVIGFMILSACGNPEKEEASTTEESVPEVVEQAQPETDIKIEVNTEKKSVETPKEDDKKLKLNLNTDKKTIGVESEDVDIKLN